MANEKQTGKPFEKGNKWWMQRATHGRKTIFKTPQHLMDSALEYFEKTSERKWMKQDFRGKDAKRVEIPTETPFTISGLCIFLGVNSHYFNDFEKSLDLETKRGRDFSDVVRMIKEIIFTQKFEGASVGAFNANIIAMELGLKSRIENNVVVEQPLFGDDED